MNNDRPIDHVIVHINRMGLSLKSIAMHVGCHHNTIDSAKNRGRIPKPAVRERIIDLERRLIAAGLDGKR